MIRDLLLELKKKANLEGDGVHELRVTAANNGKLVKELSHESPVISIVDYYNLYAERIPEEELVLQEGERVMPVFHFDKELSKTHSIPFKFVVKPVSHILSRLYSPSTDRTRERRSRIPRRGCRNEQVLKGSNLRI